MEKATLTKWFNQVDDEERQPAHNESSNHYAEGFSNSSFSLKSCSLVSILLSNGQSCCFYVAFLLWVAVLAMERCRWGCSPASSIFTSCLKRFFRGLVLLDPFFWFMMMLVVKFRFDARIVGILAGQKERRWSNDGKRTPSSFAAASFPASSNLWRYIQLYIMHLTYMTITFMKVK